MSESSNQKLNYNILKHIWNNSSEAIFTIDNNGAVIDANPTFEKLLGWKVDELANKSFPPFLADVSIDKKQALLKRIQDGQSFPFKVMEVKHKDGTRLPVLASCEALNEDNVLAIIKYKDFRMQMDIQRKLKKREEDYRALIENLPEAIIKQRAGKISLINSAGVKLLGELNEESVIGKSIWNFVRSNRRDEIEGLIHELYNADVKVKHEAIIAKFTRGDGTVIWVEVKIMPLRTDDEREIQLVLRDITEKRKYESRLEFLAYHDPLTGLKNRTIFTEIISDSIEQAKEINKKLPIMYIDIDHFKSINDTLGHSVGDGLLRLFAQRLKATVRKDDVACRIGGDEFLVLLHSVSNRVGVEKIAQRIINVIQRPFNVNGEKIQLTVSIGIAVYPQDGLTGRDLIRNADVALYQAKHKRNRYKFYSD